MVSTSASSSITSSVASVIISDRRAQIRQQSRRHRITRDLARHRIRGISGSDDGRRRNTPLFGSEHQAEVWRTSLPRYLPVEHLTDLSSKRFRGEWFAQECDSR